MKMKKIKILPLNTSHKDREFEIFKAIINRVIGWIYGLNK